MAKKINTKICTIVCVGLDLIALFVCFMLIIIIYVFVDHVIHAYNYVSLAF